jgi:hypothetical protein
MDGRVSLSLKTNLSRSTLSLDLFGRLIECAVIARYLSAYFTTIILLLGAISRKGD